MSSSTGSTSAANTSSTSAQNESPFGISAFPIDEYLSKASDGLSRTQLNLNKVTEVMKNSFRKSNAMKALQWRETFRFNMNMSFLPQKTASLIEQIERSQQEQSKYAFANPFSRGYLYPQISLPSIDEIMGNTSLLFTKDFGFMMKKNKLGLCVLFGVENMFEKYDRVQVFAWKGVHDPINEELNVKCNLFAPSLCEDNKTANCQLKLRQQFLNLENSETLLQMKYQLINENPASEFQDAFTKSNTSRTIDSATAKMTILERGISARNSLVIGLNRHTIHKKQTSQFKDKTWANQLKYGLYMLPTPLALILKSRYISETENFFKFGVGSAENTQQFNVNLKNRFEESQALSLGRIMPLCERLSANYQPGYASILLDQRNSGLVLNLQNTTKLEVFNLIKFVNPFVQLHATLQSKSFKKFWREADIRLVLSAGAAVDFGHATASVMWNVVDLAPLFAGSKRDSSFQSFQVSFSA